MMGYAKAIWAALIAAVTALAGYLVDQDMTSIEWVHVVIYAVGAGSVYLAANLPGYPYAKAFVAAVIAVGDVLVTVLTDGINSAEWMNVVLAAALALGVFGIRNKPEVTRTTGTRAA